MPNLTFLAPTVPRYRGGPKMSKVGHVTPSRPVNGVAGDPIFGFLDPDLPIHYITFTELR